jgi:hypothetical protein
MAETPLAERVDSLEAKVGALEHLPAQIARLEVVLLGEIRSGDEGTRLSLRDEIRAGDEETRRSLREEIRAGDEETRRQTRVLHEDLVERLKTIGEGLTRPNPRRKPRS